MNTDNREGASPLSRKPKNIKYYNRRLVLSLLRNSDTMTASEISERINLSVTSVTKILAALQKQGLVKSMGKGSSTEEGGKKPELFALNDTFQFVVTVHCSARDICCAIYNLKCGLIRSIEWGYRKAESFDISMEDVALAVGRLVEEESLKQEDIYAVMVSFDGIVDGDNGMLLFPIHNTAWGRNLAVEEKLRSLLPDCKRFFINNGSRLAGYAENLKHPEYRNENVLVILTGSFTGGCVLDHGKLIQGANGFVGEFGHITVEPNDRTRKCACGNSGCFETMVSPGAMLRYAEEIRMEAPDSSVLKRKEKFSYKDIFKASNEGDVYGCRVMDKMISYFVLLIRNIVLISNPKIIVLQGIYTQAGEYFLNRLRSEIHSLPFFQIEKEFTLVYSDIGLSQSCFTGGALYLADRYFKEEELFYQKEEQDS